MPRPSNTQKRRAQIVDGMLTVMAATGYTGASIQAIARAAELSPGLLHYHFSSKEQILLAVLQTIEENIAARYAARAGNEPAPDQALDAWIAWARRCRLPSFVELQRRITKHRTSILAAIEHDLSNGRIESINAKIRLITRVAFGFRSPEALIALAMLNLGGHRPTLPGRT